MDEIKLFNSHQSVSESKIYAFDVGYDEWSINVEAEESFILNHGTTERNVYTLPDGTKLYDHWVCPYPFGKKSYGYTVVDLILPVTKNNIELIKKYGGYINQEFGYTEESYGLSFFKDKHDSLKIGFNFVKNEKNKLVIDFENGQQKF